MNTEGEEESRSAITEEVTQRHSTTVRAKTEVAMTLIIGMIPKEDIPAVAVGAHEETLIGEEGEDVAVAVVAAAEVFTEAVVLLVYSKGSYEGVTWKNNG